MKKILMCFIMMFAMGCEPINKSGLPIEDVYIKCANQHGSQRLKDVVATCVVQKSTHHREWCMQRTIQAYCPELLEN